MAVIRDIVFSGPEDTIHVLDAGPYGSYHTAAFDGNGLVQVFTREGTFLRQFSVNEVEPGEKNKPGRMAMDKAGNYFISQPVLGEVWKFDAKGALAARIPYPDAYALASCARAGKNMIAVAARLPRHKASEKPEVAFIDAATGKIAQTVKLAVPIPQCISIAVDSKSNIFVLSAETAQCFKFSPQGQLVAALGREREDR